MNDDTSNGAPTEERTDGGVVADEVVNAGTGIEIDSRRFVDEQILTVAVQEYRLSFCNRWALALTGLFALVGVLLVGFGGSTVGPSDFDAYVANLVILSTYLLPLAAPAYGYDAVVGPAENGWLDVVFALSVPRFWIVVETYLGRAAILVGATLAGSVLRASRSWSEPERSPLEDSQCSSWPQQVSVPLSWWWAS